MLVFPPVALLIVWNIESGGSSEEAKGTFRNLQGTSWEALPVFDTSHSLMLLTSNRGGEEPGLAK